MEVEFEVEVEVEDEGKVQEEMQTSGYSLLQSSQTVSQTLLHDTILQYTNTPVKNEQRDTNSVR